MGDWTNGKDAWSVMSYLNIGMVTAGQARVSLKAMGVSDDEAEAMIAAARPQEREPSFISHALVLLIVLASIITCGWSPRCNEGERQNVEVSDG